MQEIKVSQFKQEQEDDNDELSEDANDEIQLEMLTEQCEQLINKLSNCLPNSILDQPTEVEDVVSEDVKKEKVRLEKQYMELCIEIERQQKELDNYKFKIKVSNKEAEYYSRQIKEKEEILNNLQKHQNLNGGGSNKKIQKTSRR